METLLTVFALATLTSGLLTFPVRGLVRRFGIVDQPNDRSSHQIATPRAGGLAIVLTLFLLVPWLIPPSTGSVLSALGVAAVALVSFRDDVRSLSFTIRLLVQLVSASLLVVALDLPVKALDWPGHVVNLPHGLGLSLSILTIVAYCNFFNFMDGINGLAAGQGVLTGSTLSMLLWRFGAGSSASVAAALAGAAAGFLPHNFPRARIFMGDVGSVTLGFVLALLSQIAHVRYGVPWTSLLLVHGLFLFDACFTVLKRMSRGESFWLPHREHNYQLLIRSGWSHPRTSLTLWGLSFLCCLAGFLYSRAGGEVQWALLVVTAASLLAFAALAHHCLRRVSSRVSIDQALAAAEPVADAK
ncbi:glycosyltransferase family 4 protein [Singulisphaera acidiphila]|uniref:UDP-N-acetylmuramyl pentapeptide phosphotransferase/UDP-N-acetylglucosamine-1-phosphate transferase n=1 Tax=Singulisphaera acidiphila (strain ATCC BAA-1392 / DSM 18658 / VKM B-2454 / MOB10) TaxID=886293 RepID=L0DH45_SINAD|nr:glycosyltransferase family 4 protein [Singulisphaera acidiphila]AGA28138.1 UDP-N-acetylmuramyl pentapeptide phosphotransferase/UDP-N-acetylglucosamine-1-phosphate transferase [Singulisphaera acidiphila DSM 18658]